ncbi:hypothetical protein BKA93DRAFT_590365 [Sparassis latifolia]
MLCTLKRAHTLKREGLSFCHPSASEPQAAVNALVVEILGGREDAFLEYLDHDSSLGGRCRMVRTYQPHLRTQDLCPFLEAGMQRPCQHNVGQRLRKHSMTHHHGQCEMTEYWRSSCPCEIEGTPSHDNFDGVWVASVRSFELAVEIDVRPTA